MKKLLVINLLIPIILTSCFVSKPQIKHDKIGAFDLNDNKLVFTYFYNDVGALYIYSLVDSTCIQITNPTNGWDLKPKFSNDGKRVVYLSYPNRDFSKVSLTLCDLETHKIDTLLSKVPLITDICFSNNERFIYFSKAKEIANYSPIVRKAPHGIDVYEIEISSKKIRQISFLKEYSINSLISTSNDSLIGMSIFKENANGMGLMNINNGDFVRYNFKNDSSYQTKEFHHPISILGDSIMFLAAYRICMYNLKEDRFNAILYRPKMDEFHTIRADTNWNNLYFTLIRNGIFKYNIKKDEISRLPIKIKK